MENITLGQLGDVILYIVVLIGSVITICKYIKSLFNKGLVKIDSKLEKCIVDSLKNFIVRCLDDLDRGIELNEVTRERLYEALDDYTNKYKQNSYIHQRVELLQREGKL